jgi:hypothetical protein
VREPAVRVAVISDVHGNAPALEAVLREVEALSPDAESRQFSD